MLLKELKKSFKLTNNFITMTCPSGMKSPKVKGVWSKSCGQAKNKNYAFADEKKKWQRNARKEWPSNGHGNNKLFPSRKRCNNVAGEGKSNKMRNWQSSMKTAAYDPCTSILGARNSKGAVDGIISHIHVTRPQRTVPNVLRHSPDGLPPPPPPPPPPTNREGGAGWWGSG